MKRMVGSLICIITIRDVPEEDELKIKTNSVFILCKK
jgi:hypothetical protein